MLFGTQRYMLDDKNRVRMPARFLEELGASPVLSPGVGGRMNIMSSEMFFKQHPQLHNPDLYDEKQQDIATALFSKTCELEPDAQGRIAIPQSIIKLLNIKKDVVFVGKLNYVEMWAAEEFETRDELLGKDKMSEMLKGLKASLQEN